MIAVLRHKKLEPLRRLLRPFVHRASGVAARVFSTTPWLASFYYCFFSRRFAREHYAVLRGRADYYRDLAQPVGTSPLLRRNTHRLEKGLIMEPRRDSFAEDYIEETVRQYQRARDAADVAGNYADDELRWAGDVLEEYFRVVVDTPVIAQARETFAGITPSSSAGAAVPNTPYPKSQLPECPISADELHSLFVRRRAVRWYEDRAVPKALIQQAINMAVLAPSACNRQPFRFLIAHEAGAARRIARLAGGTVGYADQLQALVVVVGNLSAFLDERDRHLIYIDASLAAMQLMLAAETLGLSTCPINWPDVEAREKQIQELLSLADHERVVMLMAIGYGRGEAGIPFSQKKQDEMISREVSLP